MNQVLVSNQVGGSPNQGQIIHDVLMGRLQRGEIGPDDRLVDTAVAAEFGVSRMPARDALMRLAHEGYLEATTRGFTLPRVTHEEIIEIFDLRRLLEPRAIALATLALGKAELLDLEKALADARRAMRSGNTELMFKASERFRNAWISAVPNASLKQVIQRYMTQVQAVRMMTFDDRDNHRALVNGNSDIFDAFSRRDSVAAADRIVRFIFEGETAYLNAAGADRRQSKRTAKSA